MPIVSHPIFLNYRRKESHKDARELYRELLRQFPKQVFMDAPDTAGGQHFPDLLRSKVQECRVLVAVIGPEWHCLTDDQNRVRLHQEDDWVRLEIVTALQRGIPVIPALIDGARMPVAAQLPPVLHGLLDRQAVKLDLDDFFEASIGKLCHAVRLALDTNAGVPATQNEPGLLTYYRQMAEQANQSSGAAPRLPCAKAQGDRDEFETPWADVDICGVTQRFRWIKPGTFLMGCDPGDSNGLDNEKPQHPVTLTRGFWLADTACTQQLWQAVTGKNPSRFQGRFELPVEQVSWDAVTGLFLPKVTQALGVQAALPTEAEWEYACRAGTQTPYWFGQTLTAQQANFRGSGRDKTVEVKALPANGWGLYQMHGNVWEWCAGDSRCYESQAVIDPLDKQDQIWRSLRGGASNNSQGRARAAYRFRYHSGYDRLDLYGFRFVLISKSPE